MKPLNVLFVLVVIALTTDVHPQSQVQPERNSAAPTGTDVCQSTYTSGSAKTFLEFCVTANGNIAEFQSPEHYEHIREGIIAEGYAICDRSNNQPYWDYADDGDSGNWNSSAITQPHGANTFPLKITRTTSDGIFTLTQTFSRNPKELYAKILMTLKNNSTISKSVFLIRYADIDADNGANNSLDWFFQTDDSAWGSSFPNGVMLTAPPTSVQVAPYVQGTYHGPAPCNPFVNEPSPVFHGDGSAAIAYLFTLAPGKSQSVNLEYKRF